MPSYENVAEFLQAQSHGFTDEILYVDVIEQISRKAVALTWGQGLIIDGEPKIQKLLNRVIEEDHWMEKLWISEKQNSIWGKSILYLTENRDHKPHLHNLYNIFNGRVAKIDESEQVADIWNQNFQGDSNYFTETIITPKYIEVRNYGGDFSEINMVKAAIQDGLEPESYVKLPNKFDSLPVVEIINLPIINMFNQSQLNVNPDWAPAMGLIKLYNTSFLIANKEIVANRSRYFGFLPAYKMNELRKHAKEMLGVNDIMGDAWVNQSFATAYSNQATGSSLQVIQGNPQLQEYAAWLLALEVKIMNISGYEANQKVNESTYENETASTYSNKLDAETTHTKQKIRLPKLYQLLDCVLRFYNIEPRDKDGVRKYSVSIINSGIEDTVLATDDTIKQQQAGYISKVEARARLLHEPMNIAEQNIKKVQQFELEEQKQLGEMNNQLMKQMGEDQEPDQLKDPAKNTLAGKKETKED